MAARVALIFGVVLLVFAGLAATSTPNIVYLQFHTAINGEWSCGSVVNPAQITDELGVEVGAQSGCDEQIRLRAVLAVVFLVVGTAATVYGVRRLTKTTVESIPSSAVS